MASGHEPAVIVVRLEQPGTGAQETELIEAMQAADLDGDGTINYEEFIVATVNLAKLEKVCFMLECASALQAGLKTD